LHEQFQSLFLGNPLLMNGDGARRSDPLYKIGHTESTQASDLQAGLTSRTGMPSARATFFQSTNKYKPMMEEIA